MDRKCEQCGKPFKAKRSDARFCGPTCRSKRSLGEPPAPVGDREPDDFAKSGLVSATVKELARINRLASPLGQDAVMLAERMTRAEGAALASLSKEYRAALEAATANAHAAADPVDELQSRRAQRLGA